MNIARSLSARLFAIPALCTPSMSVQPVRIYHQHWNHSWLGWSMYILQQQLNPRVQLWDSGATKRQILVKFLSQAAPMETLCPPQDIPATPIPDPNDSESPLFLTEFDPWFVRIRQVCISYCGSRATMALIRDTYVLKSARLAVCNQWLHPPWRYTVLFLA